MTDFQAFLVLRMCVTCIAQQRIAGIIKDLPKPVGVEELGRATDIRNTGAKQKMTDEKQRRTSLRSSREDNRAKGESPGAEQDGGAGERSRREEQERSRRSRGERGSRNEQEGQRCRT